MEQLSSNNEEFKTTGGFEKGTFEITTCDIEDVEIAKIQQYQGMPAYLDKTESLRPVVIKTPEGHFLVDGNELLEEAWVEGKEKLKCFVYYMDEHNEAEISLFILGMRTKPQGGAARYAEIIRNVRTCKNNLEETNENLIRHSQGGRRRGQAFNEADKSGTINMILMASTGRGKSSVGDYLAHSDFIDNNTLNFLAACAGGDSHNANAALLHVVDCGATKSFFKNIHTKKRVSVMNLQGKKVHAQEIVAIISEKVLAAFMEDPTGKKVTVFDELVGEKVENLTKKVKVTESVKKEVENILAETAGSQNDETHEENQLLTGNEHQSSGANSIEEQKEGKKSPAYIKLLESQGNRLLEIAKSQEQPLRIAEDVEAVIIALTEALTEIRSFTEDSDFLEAA